MPGALNWAILSLTLAFKYTFAHIHITSLACTSRVYPCCRWPSHLADLRRINPPTHSLPYRATRAYKSHIWFCLMFSAPSLWYLHLLSTASTLLLPLERTGTITQGDMDKALVHYNLKDEERSKQVRRIMEETALEDDGTSALHERRTLHRQTAFYSSSATYQ